MSTAKPDIKLHSLGCSPVGGRENVYVSGLSHHTAAIATRERFSLCDQKTESLLKQLLTGGQVSGAVITSTCNRVEIVWTSRQEIESFDFIEQALSVVTEVEIADFAKYGYHIEGSNAVRHVFRVASGLDSMVVGENQILHQLKQSYEFSRSRDSSGQFLNRMFSKAFAAAKEVRTRTRIGERSLSVCSVARELAEQVLGDLSSAKIALLGAGETGRLALKHFRAAGASRFIVANRSIGRAEELAKDFAAEACLLTECRLSEADVIIGAASLESSDSVLVGVDQVRNSIRERKSKPQLFIDLAVPRNFNSKIAEVEDSYLYNIDHLEEVVSHNLGQRREEIEQAEELVSLAVVRFGDWRELQFVEPLISGATKKLDLVRKAEIARTMKQFRAGEYQSQQLEEIEQALEAFSRSLMSRTLSRPINSLKQEPETNLSVFDTFRRFFGG